MTRAEYDAHPALSSSALRLAACDGWRAYEWEYVIGHKRESTPEQETGTLIHLLTLQPELFEREYRLIPDSALSKSGSRAGGAWAAFSAQCHADGVRPIKAAEHDGALAVSDVARKSLWRWLDGATIETPVLTTDPDTGEMLKALPDFVDGEGCVWDLKTTSANCPDEFCREVQRLKYWVQEAHYLAVTEMEAFRWACVTKAEPYHCFVCELSLESMLDAQRAYRRLLEDFSARKEDGNWADVWEGTCSLLEVRIYEN